MVVRSVSRGTFVIVPPIALVGRDPANAVVLESDQASAIHAELRWHGGGWDLRDKGSRNGTSLDGGRLTGGIPVAVGGGALLQFGDRSEVWQVVDAEPPLPALFDPRTGAVERPVDGRLGPLVLDPVAGWLFGDRPTPHGAALGGRSLFAPLVDPAHTTAPARIALDRARIRIVTSTDLVAIDIHVEHGTERVWFSERAWAIALFLLAQARIADPDDGWIDVDRLARRAGLARKVLDIYLKRARVAFVDAGIAAGDQIVEVRRGGRRLGVRDVVVDVRA